jgi:hypothetical protein
MNYGGFPWNEIYSEHYTNLAKFVREYPDLGSKLNVSGTPVSFWRYASVLKAYNKRIEAVEREYFEKEERRKLASARKMLDAALKGEV